MKPKKEVILKKIEKEKQKKEKEKQHDFVPKDITLKKISRFLSDRHKAFFSVDLSMFLLFKISCLHDQISPSILVHAFMNAYVQGHPCLEEFMKNCTNFTDKKIFIRPSFYRKMEKMRVMIDFCNKTVFEEFSDQNKQLLESFDFFPKKDQP